jgi:peptidoglycan/xylan/chitin deacetylase (PgdA/CDA1 family)
MIAIGVVLSAISAISAISATPTGSQALPEAASILRPDLGGGRVAHGHGPHRLLHLTFDDGPRPGHTPRLLDLLDRYGVRATFFLIGRLLDERRHPRTVELVREIARRGHTLGLHGYDHRPMGRMSAAELRDQFRRSERLFGRVFGERPSLLRPPLGSRTRLSDRVAAQHGYTIFRWNLSFDRFEHESRPISEWQEHFERVFASRDQSPRGPSLVILLHDTHSRSVEIVPFILERVRARNCELLRSERGGRREELWEVVGDPGLFVQPRDPGRLVQYAAPARLAPEALARRQARVREEAARLCAARHDEEADRGDSI